MICDLSEFYCITLITIRITLRTFNILQAHPICTRTKTFNRTHQINTRIRTGYQSLSFSEKTASKSLIFNIPSSSDASDVPNLDISFIVLLPSRSTPQLKRIRYNNCTIYQFLYNGMND